MGKPFRYSIELLFKESKLLILKQPYIVDIIRFVYKTNKYNQLEYKINTRATSDRRIASPIKILNLHNICLFLDQKYATKFCQI